MYEREQWCFSQNKNRYKAGDALRFIEFNQLIALWYNFFFMDTILAFLSTFPTSFTRVKVRGTSKPLSHGVEVEGSQAVPL